MAQPGRARASGPPPPPGLATGEGFYQRVYACVQEVPRGRVTTYGTVSELVVGRPDAARTVGWALRALPEALHDSVPWWRVINAAGRISNSNRELDAVEQRRRLEAEGLPFGPDGRVDLDVHGWWG